MTDKFKVLIVDDEIEYIETYKILLESRGYRIESASSAEAALEKLSQEYHHLVLCDVVMPGMGGIEALKAIKRNYLDTQVIMVTGYGGVETAVEAMKLGAFGYFIKSHNPEELILEIQKALKLVSLQQRQKYLDSGSNHLFMSNAPKMQEIYQNLNKIARSNANVLLLGESGVGKEVIAKRLHELSERSEMPFIPINCQYFTTELLQSELFGHEKGAFTGANEKRIGRFEEGSGGTIFLDEIGEVSMDTQVKFLRVLENRTIERIGSNRPIHVNFKLICATNKDLHKQISLGSFREDLFYRINTITIDIPPLRDRRSDIPGLIDFFLEHYRWEFKKNVFRIEDETMEFLLNYSYPGNIRELKNLIERMFVLEHEGVLRLDKMPSTNGSDKFNDSKSLKITNFNRARREFEKEFIIKALMGNGNNVTRTASVIGLSRRQLFNKISEYNIRDISE